LALEHRARKVLLRVAQAQVEPEAIRLGRTIVVFVYGRLIEQQTLLLAL